MQKTLHALLQKYVWSIVEFYGIFVIGACTFSGRGRVIKTKHIKRVWSRKIRLDSLKLCTYVSYLVGNVAKWYYISRAYRKLISFSNRSSSPDSFCVWSWCYPICFQLKSVLQKWIPIHIPQHRWIIPRINTVVNTGSKVYEYSIDKSICRQIGKYSLWLQQHFPKTIRAKRFRACVLDASGTIIRHSLHV